MRAAVFVEPAGEARAVSEEPLDVFELGNTPRHRITGPVFLQDGVRLKLRRAPGDPVLVRLPRRLTKLPLSDAARWIRGLEPDSQDLLSIREINIIPLGGDPLAGRSAMERAWELRYPRQGLGVPKPLPRRRRRATPEEQSELFRRISDSLHQIGVDYAAPSQKERLLGARAFVEQAVARTGGRLTSYEVTAEGDVHVQFTAPLNAIEFRVVLGPEVETDDG